jgi:glucose-6-phosphate isomerase
MSLPKINPTQTKAWQQLQAHFASIRETHMNTLFQNDATRVDTFSISWDDFYIDYSKNRITSETMTELLKLAKEVNLSEAIKAQFAGETINQTEGRAVMHTALRDFGNMKPEVKATLDQIKCFSEGIISGSHTGYTGKAITDVVNIGIGGSHLGPDMATKALQFYKNHLNIHYISNVEGDHVQEVLKGLNSETTLFIIVSKTFTTIETLTNSNTIRSWFLSKTSEQNIAKHFAAVSTNLEAVAAFGITKENIFPMWDWVGGRFSLWSAVGLSISCGIGYEHFESLLRGAHAMDKHFQQTPLEENIPVVLGLLSVWYNNFFNAESEAVMPYSEYLEKLVPYLQQAIMESNGKEVDRNGAPVDYQTGTIVWGRTGTNAQHAFFQLLHQGTKLIPSDFICFAESLHDSNEHQEILLANCFAQTEALMEGTHGKDVSMPYKKFNGNKPTNTLLIKKLTPHNLGSLIAIYEHKLFVQGVIWNIYSYDQWGVELGKNVAQTALVAIQTNTAIGIKNLSTKGLLNII